MLNITIPAIDGWDDDKQEFVDIKPSRTLSLEQIRAFTRLSFKMGIEMV